MRSVVPLWVVVAVLAGCLAGPAPTDEEDEGPGPAPSDDGASVLGRLFLHTDGERHWMDDAPGADADLLVVVPPTASSASYTFPLDPPLGMDVATAGVAVVQLSMTSGGVTAIEPATTTAELLVDGTPTDEQERQGDRPVFDLAAPDALPAGTPVALRITFRVDSLSAWTARLHTGGASWMDVPGPASGGLVEGTVDVRQEGGRFVASRTDIFARADSDSGGATLGLRTVNGPVAAAGAEDGGLLLEAVLAARGATEAEARDRLKDLHVDVGLEEDPLRLAARVESRATGAQRWNDRSGSLALRIADGGTVDDATLRTTNGDVTWTGLDAAAWSASTTNGGIDVQDASLDAASGGTTNGEIDARLGTPGASGRHDWTSTNGDIHVTLDTAGIGIDAEGRTTNGDVTFDFAGTEDVGTQSRQHRHVRSADYASRDVQTVIVLGTTNGAIDAGDA